MSKLLLLLYCQLQQEAPKWFLVFVAMHAVKSRLEMVLDTFQTATEPVLSIVQPDLKPQQLAKVNTVVDLPPPRLLLPLLQHKQLLLLD
ncbi:Indole-3-glycerol phosphate synthase [Trichinella pseudospiralis]